METDGKHIGTKRKVSPTNSRHVISYKMRKVLSSNHFYRKGKFLSIALPLLLLLLLAVVGGLGLVFPLALFLVVVLGRLLGFLLGLLQVLLADGSWVSIGIKRDLAPFELALVSLDTETGLFSQLLQIGLAALLVFLG